MSTFLNTQTFEAIIADAFNLSAAPAAGYVLTSDVSGNGSWAPVAFNPGVTVQTTDATPAALLTVPVGASSVVTLTGMVAAADSAYTAAVGGTFTITARRAGGAAAALSNPVVIVSSESAATFDAILSGDDLIVQVTGVAATTINWRAEYNTVVYS